MRYFLASLLALSFLGKMTAQPTNGFTIIDGKPIFYQSDKFNKFQTLNTLTIPKGNNLDSVYYARDTNSVFQWDQIPAEDLAMNSYALDTSAEAVVLFDVGFIEAKTSFPEGFSSTFSRYKRIKILKKSAFTTVGNIKIRFQAGEEVGSLRQLQAQVIQPDGTKRKLVDLTDFFFEQNKTNFTARFAFPDLTEGSIIEYRYKTVRYNNIFTLMDWYFQEDIPVRHSELFLTLPETLEYHFLYRGGKYPKLTKLKDSTHLAFLKYAMANDRTTHFSIDSITAMKKGDYVTTMDNHRGSIHFQLSRHMSVRGKLEPIVDTWANLANFLAEHPLLGEQYLKKSNYKSVWKAVKKELSDTMSVGMKINTMYNYLSKNVSWIDGDFSAFADGELDKAFKKRKANSAELNLMLIACMRESDIQAVPMLLSTRDNGKPMANCPILSQFNHLVCVTESTDPPLLLDVGTLHRPPGLIRTASLNGYGWLLQGQNSRWVNIYPSVSTETLTATFALTKTGSVKGSMIRQYTGYNAVNELLKNQDTEKDAHLRKELAADFTGISIDSIQITGKDDHKANLKQVVYCTIENAAVVANDLIYLKPILKTKFDQSPFKLADRNYPVEFPYPMRDEFVLKLTLPDDYEVEELPQSVSAVLGNKGGRFEYSATKSENSILLSVKIEVKQLVFPVKDYGLVKAFFDQIAAKQAEQIVLRKKKQ